MDPNPYLRGHLAGQEGDVMGGCHRSLWHRFQRGVPSGKKWRSADPALYYNRLLFILAAAPFRIRSPCPLLSSKPPRKRTCAGGGSRDISGHVCGRQGCLRAERCPRPIRGARMRPTAGPTPPTAMAQRGPRLRHARALGGARRTHRTVRLETTFQPPRVSDPTHGPAEL